MILINQKKGGVILSYAQMISNVLVKFIYTPFLLGALGQNEYGLFSLVMSIVGYLAILDMGFGSTVTRYAVRYNAVGDKENLYKLYGTLSVIYIGIGLLAMFVCICLNLCSNYLFGSTMTFEEVSKLKVMMILCGVNLLFSFPLQIATSVIVAYERFIFKNGLNLLRTFAQPALIIFLLYLIHIKAIGVIVVVTSFNLITYLLYYLYAVKKLDFKFSISKFTPTMLPMLVKFSGWMFFLMVFEQLQYNSGQFILGIFQGTDKIAVWGIAMIFILNYRSLSTSISNVYLPSFISLRAKDDIDGMNCIINKMVKLQTSILIIILCNFILYGFKFLELWAGNTYLDAYYICLIIMIPMTIALVFDFSYLYQIAANQLKYRVWTTFSCYTVAFILVYFFSEITLTSYAFIMAISMILGQILMPLFYIKSNMRISIYSILLIMLKIICPLFLFVGLTYAIRYVTNIGAIWYYGAEIMVFNILILMCLLYTFSKEERQSLLFR